MKIIIISWVFSPLNVIGSGRPASWARYWSEAGHDVTVITTKKSVLHGSLGFDYSLPDDVKVLEVGFSGRFFWFLKGSRPWWLRFLPHRQRRIIFVLLYRWMRRFWVKKAFAKAVEVQEPIDAVVSCFGPPESHEVARLLKDKFPRLKWIADFRDLWTQADSNWTSSNNEMPTQQDYSRSYEVDLLASADLMTTVSRGLAERFSRIHQHPFFVSYNGFEGEIAPPVRTVSVTEGKLNLVYTGALYEIKYRNPLPLYTALSQLKSRCELSTEVHYFGPSNPSKDHAKLIEDAHLKSEVVFHGRVSRSESHERQVHAGALLFLGWGMIDEKGSFSGKIFEYLQVGVPIIAIGGLHDREVVDTIENTGHAKFFDEGNLDELVDTLSNLQNGILPHWFRPNSEAVKFFHRKNQADLLMDEILSL